MSFQGYVDSSLIATGNIDKAAIFSGVGDSVWGTSTGFSATPQELQSIIEGLSDAGPLHDNGLYLNGQKYLVTSADRKSLQAKKDHEGVYVFKTNQALILAHSPEGVAHEAAASVTKQLGDYLTGMGQ
ncbi:hypothetical protein ASPWEDRAFT_172164 [Aspergillus wentii DTO 134E9]|uniref:Profilin n=1 Tax=Aspergillus wentii DTO 134E9 TaxID=1073089 RepID=A0A1L9RK96_ASPWE|nr:uncharacterized protein ASPWEDRAFT_172164 [Aspergillus wentii DTO 134E9]KAI9924874.1 profilin, required for normal timing of actin polymerization in response to thermal stress [Aspergillus wentii]OJJ35352.1 hypothetical protein ASPWEDRAFT_172164 [Aspergillus wentii DTO 134E9]